MDDLEVAGVTAQLVNADPDGTRFARTLRRTFDQIYDGQHTGRFRWEDLRKTEKTHFGSLIEINLHREFDFEDGLNLDYRIAGTDVDCKWSQNDGGWMLPPEAIGQICLLVTGSDERSVWSAGVIRAIEPLLNLRGNRDAKKTLNTTGRKAIHWIWRDAQLPENVLLHIDQADLQAIMAGSKSGQKRVTELFRRVPHRLIGRGIVATVAQQDDYMRRVRENGGSRGYLKAHGIVILGQYLIHRQLASRLGLPAIGDGDSISAKLKQIDGPANNAVELEGRWYRLCSVGEEPTMPAPNLPKLKK